MTYVEALAKPTRNKRGFEPYILYERRSPTVKKFFLVVLAAMLISALGCSGDSGLTPDRDTYQDMVGTNPEYNGIAGTFTITDVNGMAVAEGDLVRDENGLSVSEMRNGDILIDLTWLKWIDAECDFLNPRGFNASGWALYWYGDTIEYDLCITNYGCTISNATVKVRHQHLYTGWILPGSQRTWYNVYLPGGNLTKIYDEYHAIYNGWIGVWGTVIYPVNFWCIHIDIILYNGICGVWDP
jgi:hypothetical protein